MSCSFPFSLASGLCFATTCRRCFPEHLVFAATHPLHFLANSGYCLVCRYVTLLLTRVFSQGWSQGHHSKGDVEEMRHHCCNCLNPPRRSILHDCCMLLALTLKRVICIRKVQHSQERAFWVLDKGSFLVFWSECKEVAKCTYLLDP